MVRVLEKRTEYSESMAEIFRAERYMSITNMRITLYTSGTNTDTFRSAYSETTGEEILKVEREDN